MPYIKREEREQWDEFLQPVLTVVNNNPEMVNPGALNYFISSIIWSEFDRNPSYTRGNELVGVLECVKQEFLRRKLAILEDEKIKSNGDL